eukprot:561657-Hanusia_phi.AAC.1
MIHSVAHENFVDRTDSSISIAVYERPGMGGEERARRRTKTRTKTNCLSLACVDCLVAGSLVIDPPEVLLRVGECMPPVFVSARGTGLQFRVYPPLPRGLVLDPITGTICGIPEEDVTFGQGVHRDGIQRRWGDFREAAVRKGAGRSFRGMGEGGGGERMGGRMKHKRREMRQGQEG